MRELIYILLLMPSFLFAQRDIDGRRIYGNVNVKKITSNDIVNAEGLHYDIRAYGAIANDSIDDYTAISEAIDSCQSNGGGIAYFPPGTYETNAVITLTGLEKITLKGEGAATILKMKTGANQDQIMLIDSCSNITIEKMTFDNNEANQTGGEIRCIQTADTVNNLTIRDCIFDGNGRTLGSYGIWLIECYDSVIDNIFVDGWNGADFLVFSNLSQFISVRNSTFKNIQYCAITGAAQSKYININNNNFYNIGDEIAKRGHAVNIVANLDPNKSYWPSDYVVSNNIAQHCFGDVIHVEEAYRVIITNNIINGFWETASGDSSGDTGISCNAAQSIISNNHVSGMGGPGITLFSEIDGIASGDMVAMGNITFDNGRHSDPAVIQRNGIWLDDATRCLVIGNISGNSGDSLETQWRGIYSSGVSEHNLVVSNLLLYNRDHGIYFANSDSELVYNNLIWENNASNPIAVEMSGFSQKGDIDAKEFGGHKQTLRFYYEDVTAGLTDAEMQVFGMHFYSMPFDGSVLGVTVRANEECSAGSCTVEVNVWNAGIGLTAVLNAGNTWVNTTLQNKDIDTFPAEATISVKITTSGDWAPTTADIVVMVLIEL